MKPRLYMIIPCYNEEKVLPITSEMFLEELNLLITKDKISENSRILFVNDGSKDKTWDLIKELSEKDEHFIGICQSRNRGHQNAVSAVVISCLEITIRRTKAAWKDCIWSNSTRSRNRED